MNKFAGPRALPRESMRVAPGSPDAFERWRWAVSPMFDIPRDADGAAVTPPQCAPRLSQLTWRLILRFLLTKWLTRTGRTIFPPADETSAAFRIGKSPP